MKLNMWMIANRLIDYDTEMELEPEAEAVLNSTLPYYAPGCVYISGAGDDIVCESDQGYIKIRDISLSDGYLLIQGIFDWYQDWLDKVDRAVMSGNFEHLAQLCQIGFGNPVMLQDANYCLLGMAGTFGKQGKPPEWEYILQHGQSSVEGYECMATALRYSKDIYRRRIRKFKGRPGTPVPDSGIHSNITFNGKNYQKLTILERNREINRGDICLLEYLSRRLAIYMAAVSGESRHFLDIGVLEMLIMGEDVPEDKIGYFQSIICKRRPGKMAVMLVDFLDQERRGDTRALQLLKNIVSLQYPDTVCRIVQGQLMLLLFSLNPNVLAEQIFLTIQNCGYKKMLRAGVSLGFYELSELYYFFEQAVQAQAVSQGQISRYYGLAVQNLMESSGIRQICSCEPTLRHMWLQGTEKQTFLLTLETYLEENMSSSRAAQKLFIHKNTLTYRIKYLKDNTEWDFNDSYTRDYLRFSLYVLKKMS